MHKVKITAILFFLMAMLLAGCGSEEETTTQAPVEVNVLVGNEKEENNKDDLENEAETVPELPVKFDCLDEIKNASPDSGLLQIDDMILKYGSTGAEILEIIKQSECEYTADYNENQLVPAGESEMIYFEKNGENYFGIRFRNFGTDTLELKDCVIDIISAIKASKGNVYYAGVGGEIVTYDSVKESLHDYEPEREFTGYDSRHNKNLAVLYKIPDANGIVQDFGNEIYTYYIFDMDTNELSSFLICGYKYSDSALPW